MPTPHCDIDRRCDGLTDATFGGMDHSNSGSELFADRPQPPRVVGVEHRGVGVRRDAVCGEWPHVVVEPGNVVVFEIHPANAVEQRARRAENKRRRTLLDGFFAYRRVDDRGTVIVDEPLGSVRDELARVVWSGSDNDTRVSGERADALSGVPAVELDLEKDPLLRPVPCVDHTGETHELLCTDQYAVGMNRGQPQVGHGEKVRGASK